VEKISAAARIDTFFQVEKIPAVERLTLSGRNPSGRVVSSGENPISRTPKHNPPSGKNFISRKTNFEWEKSQLQSSFEWRKSHQLNI